MQLEDVLSQILQLLELRGIVDTNLGIVAERVDYPLDEFCHFSPDKETLSRMRCVI